MIIEKRDYYNHGAIEAIDAIEFRLHRPFRLRGVPHGQLPQVPVQMAVEGHRPRRPEESPVLPRQAHH